MVSLNASFCFCRCVKTKSLLGTITLKSISGSCLPCKEVLNQHNKTGSRGEYATQKFQQCHNEVPNGIWMRETRLYQGFSESTEEGKCINYRHESNEPAVPGPYEGYHD